LRCAPDEWNSCVSASISSEGFPLGFKASNL
jgi:hypothetical protein